MEYKIGFRKTQDGYSVSVPALPGCWSQGATKQEALQAIQDAIRKYLAAREEIMRCTAGRETTI